MGYYTGSPIGILSVSPMSFLLVPGPDFDIGTPGRPLTDLYLGSLMVSATDTYYGPPSNLSSL